MTHRMSFAEHEGDAATVAAELIAVVVAVTADAPRVLTIEGGRALPSGPFESVHRSLQASLRSWVERQTHHPLGYVEQLYTFADRDRAEPDRRVVSVSYLGLTREAPAEPLSGSSGAAATSDRHGVRWRDWYRYFPWEDRREPVATTIQAPIEPLLEWAEAGADAMLRWQRRNRVAINFGLDAHPWNEELVLQRYETLWEAGLVPEAQRNARSAGAMGAELGETMGDAMAHDHRRILATGIARLRGKIKYRPVVFELMPPAFTLGQLQGAMQALAGRRLHKQNFRRLMEQQELVEETGRMATETGGRPAKLYRFRREVLVERSVAGSKLPLVR